MKSDITIKMARCKGCGICVAFCPKQVLALDELGKVHVVNGEACIACGQCTPHCPQRIAIPKQMQRISDYVTQLKSHP